VHNQYLLGRQITLAGRPGAFSKALVHFRKAVELDPDYAAAHPGLLAAMKNFWSFNGYHLRTLRAVRGLAAELRATAEREAAP
jgi:hypothetical protein